MLANGVNIGVVSKLLGHASLQVTLDSYGTFHDQLMLSNVHMIREKLISKTDEFEMYELETAQQSLLNKFKITDSNN